MAWYAIKLTLTAIHGNYDLYTFFGTGLSDISEIMIIIRHYDLLYDERSKPEWKPSPLVEKLFQDVISAYAAVLDFSFAIKRHLTAGALTRIKHGFKDFFGISKAKFEDKMDAVATLKLRILEESQGAFQDKTLTQLQSVSTVLAGIEDTVQHIRGFQDTQKKLHEDAMARFDVLLKGLDDIRASTKRKTRWDYALQDYQGFQDALGPLEGSIKVYGDMIDAVYPGTCQWVFEERPYKMWASSADNAMLCITGPEGRLCPTPNIAPRSLLTRLLRIWQVVCRGVRRPSHNSRRCRPKSPVRQLQRLFERWRAREPAVLGREHFPHPLVTTVLSRCRGWRRKRRRARSLQRHLHQSEGKEHLP
jgi:hypothetical protein